MAHRAINRINLIFMIFRSVILYLVASDTISWGIEYRSLVTGGALRNSGVTARQLKASSGMVKGRGLPTGWSMASLALNG